MQKLGKVLKFLLYLLPAVLFFSYYPIISLGRNDSMNFELSLPLVWLVVFDVVGFLMMLKERILLKAVSGRKWLWLLFPVWASLSLIWSLNLVRGVLTVGIMWLVFFAGYMMWSFRRLLDDEFRVRWWKWFFGSTLAVCVWCVAQCVLDLVGVSQDCSLMCDGCTYHMFGFPHPNGFAIEPQFMGNLLIAPAIAAVYIFVKGGCNGAFRGRTASARCHERGVSGTSCRFLNLKKILLLISILATLFLTFSRGAIYALVVGMLFMSGFLVFGTQKKERKECVKRVGMAWGLVVLSFVVVLNLQGLMAEVGPTNDTYYDGVAKVLNHLSLGIVDIRGEKVVENSENLGEKTEREMKKSEYGLVENFEEKHVEEPVENFGEKDEMKALESNQAKEAGEFEENNQKEEAVFNGYVTESTDVRVKLTGAALEVWSGDWKTAMLGVGIGGAGVALYNNGLSSSPKEIVQNEYASLLLEVGLVGVSLLVLVMVLVIRVVLKSPMRAMILSLLVAYGISLMFFSGFANALQIYLLPIVLTTLTQNDKLLANDNYKARRKKLVS